LLKRWGQRSGNAAASNPLGGDAPAIGRILPAEHGAALPGTKRQAAPQPVLDRDVLDELHAVIGESASQIVSEFLDDAPAMVQQLQQAAQNGDAPRMQA
ncbi:hypothetical protein, partial [Listeria seeligeri]|uniref:hypothetical protein n=1 Tax=Listeria seeligeri TaxID=1640 RepID=UPI0022EC0859